MKKKPVLLSASVHLGQVYLPQSIVNIINAAILIGAALLVLIFFAVLKLYRRFEFSIFESVFLSGLTFVATAILIAVAFSIYIKFW